MPYCTLDDLKQDISETELQQLTDDERLGTVNEARINAAIGDAGDLIDGFLRGRYTLPLDPAPTIIKTIAKEITIYRLFLRKKRQTISKEMTDNYNAQIKLLKGIQQGEIQLGIAATPTEAAGEGAYRTNKTATSRTFSDDVLDTM
jgi:phage gp36-like protein